MKECEDRCELCKYYKRLKHNFRKGEGFELSYCCDVLYHLDDNEGAWVQEVTPEDMCEMFTRRAE